VKDKELMERIDIVYDKVEKIENKQRHGFESEDKP